MARDEWAKDAWSALSAQEYDPPVAPDELVSTTVDQADMTTIIDAIEPLIRAELAERIARAIEELGNEPIFTDLRDRVGAEWSAYDRAASLARRIGAGLTEADCCRGICREVADEIAARSDRYAADHPRRRRTSYDEGYLDALDIAEQVACEVGELEWLR